MTPTEIARSQSLAAETADDLGTLPEWNLDDLYPGMDDPALKRDLALSEPEAAAFEAKYKGKLDGLAATSGAALAQAVVAFEALDELLGRIVSFAGLLHAGDTSDPARAKFYGDVQEKITTASAHLLFFTLELNRIDDAVLEAALADPGARPLPAVARGHPQGEALPARGPGRAALPREVGDRTRRLEPAVRRDDDGAPLHGRRTRARASSRRSTCCRTRTRAKRKAAAEALAATFKDEHPPLHPHHQHARQGQGDLRPLARLQGRRRRAPPRQPRRAGGGRRAGRRRCAPPIRACRTATTR